MPYQNTYALFAYSDNPLVENLGPMGLVLKSAVIPDFQAGTPVNAVAASGVLTATNNTLNTATVTIGSKVYTFKTALTEAKATGTLTLADNPSNNETVAIGPLDYEQTYTFKTSLTSATAANEVLIGADASATIDNLIAAINKAAGGGTTYGSDTAANSYVVAVVGAEDTMTATAKEVGTEYNDVLTTGSGGSTWGDTNLTGGVDAIANEVKVGSDASGSLDNLIAAVNGTAGEGTDYSTGTVAHTLVTAAVGDGDTITVTAKTKGTAGNSIAKAETSGNLDWDGTGAYLTGGVDGTVAGQFAVYVDGTYFWIAVADNTIADANWKKLAWA